MSQLHFSWLELGILIPLAGWLVVGRLRDAVVARHWCLVFTGAALVCTFAEWQDFQTLKTFEAEDRWQPLAQLFGPDLFVVDELSAPLLPHVALLFFLTTLATLRTKIRRFSFSWTLLSEAILLATFSCKEPWLLIALLALGTLRPYWELRARGKPTRVYTLHMGLYVALLVFGQAFVSLEDDQRVHTLWAIVPLMAAVLVRSGIVPFHCWVTELFEHATFGTALLYVAPLTGAYAAMRLVLPIAPDWVLRGLGLISLVTAVYAAALTLIQTDARRFFALLFLSHSALVLVGLEIVTPIGLTGALCLWLSVGLSLGGFGLMLRALESRHGRISLVEFQGLYEHMPILAICFIITGLASVGFPGTSGFIGTELLVDGAVAAYPYTGVAVVIAAALNGIALVQTYFRLFTGTQYASMISLRLGGRERAAVLTLMALILLGGLAPQFSVSGRYHAALALLKQRGVLSNNTEHVSASEAESLVSPEM
uniref:Oxidoreductase n=1 Tax=Schlesneria paludicola TaxID=360056 RepID=A0A7C2JXL6_9PLAN